MLTYRNTSSFYQITCHVRFSFYVVFPKTVCCIVYLLECWIKRKQLYINLCRINTLYRFLNINNLTLYISLLINFYNPLINLEIFELLSLYRYTFRASYWLWVLKLLILNFLNCVNLFSSLKHKNRDIYVDICLNKNIPSVLVDKQYQATMDNSIYLCHILLIWSLLCMQFAGNLNILL